MITSKSLFSFNSILNLSTNIQKWWQTIKISWSNLMVYRFNFFLMIIAPLFVFFFIRYNIWQLIYSSDPQRIIQGYSFTEMINYQIWVLIVSLISQGHNSIKLAEDIRLGRISSYLVYPFEFWQFHMANFIGEEIIQIVIALFTLMIFLIFKILSSALMVNILFGIFFSILVSFLWFALQYLIGLIAFWLEETWVLRVILITLSQFLSGAIIPLEIFPSWLLKWVNLSPFPYLTAIPVKIFMNRHTENLGSSLMILLFWIFFVTSLCHLVWKKGLKNYSGSGM